MQRCHQPMMWIAYDPSVVDHKRNREQFNGEKPDWMDTEEEFQSKQGVDVPMVGDELLELRMGRRRVERRRLCSPEPDDAGRIVTGWYWTIFVR